LWGVTAVPTIGRWEALCEAGVIKVRAPRVNGLQVYVGDRLADATGCTRLRTCSVRAAEEGAKKAHR